MTGEFVLDWAVMAVSLFNTILLLWLGLTVLLNAERRTWGVWLVGGGLLMGGAFFVSHSAILGHSLTYAGQGLDFWWHVGWVPVVASPFAWYVVMLWYAGFLGRPRRRRCAAGSAPGSALTVLLAVGLAGLLLFANPLPSLLAGDLSSHLSAAPSLGGIPLLILVYPLYIVLCISLSLDVLRRPGPSGRVMGDLARRRARPWLVAASVALLLVSLLVALVMLWVALLSLRPASARRCSGYLQRMALTVAWFDLVIAALIAAADHPAGTGRRLLRDLYRQDAAPARLPAPLAQRHHPGGRLRRGGGLEPGDSIAPHLQPAADHHPDDGLLRPASAGAPLPSASATIGRLRPFVASQRLYEHLLTRSPSAPPDVDVATPFRALCDDVLGARVAYLAALGPLAPLVGPPLVYPDGNTAALPR